MWYVNQKWSELVMKHRSTDILNGNIADIHSSSKSQDKFKRKVQLGILSPNPLMTPPHQHVLQVQRANLHIIVICLNQMGEKGVPQTMSVIYEVPSSHLFFPLQGYLPTR